MRFRPRSRFIERERPLGCPGEISPQEGTDPLLRPGVLVTAVGVGLSLALKTRGKRQLWRCESIDRRNPRAKYRTEFTLGQRVTQRRAEQHQISTFHTPTRSTSHITRDGTCSAKYTANLWDQLNFISQGKIHSQKLSIMGGKTPEKGKSPDSTR